MLNVQPPDFTSWLIPYIRNLPDLGSEVEVDDHVPHDLTGPLSLPLVIVRDDGSTPTSHVTFDWTGAITVYANTRAQAKLIARNLYSHLTNDTLAEPPASPVAAVDRSAFLGPYAIPDVQPLAAQYFTIGYSTVGSW